MYLNNYRHYKDALFVRDDLRLTISVKKDEGNYFEVIGEAYCHSGNQVAYSISEEYRRQGYMYEAMKFFIPYIPLSFAHLVIHNDNVASNALAKKLGCKLLGIQRHKYHKEIWWNVYRIVHQPNITFDDELEVTHD